MRQMIVSFDLLYSSLSDSTQVNAKNIILYFGLFGWLSLASWPSLLGLRSPDMRFYSAVRFIVPLW